MIKANELRIGNWVDYQGKKIKVENVNDGGINGEWDSCWATYFHEDLSGIPLSQDILQTAGFEKAIQLTTGEWTYSIGDFDFKLLSNSAFLQVEYSDFGIEIKNVHHLQNLYFALTGEELEMKSL